MEHYKRKYKEVKGSMKLEHEPAKVPLLIKMVLSKSIMNHQN
jgi:hypothetical protein